MSTDVQDHKTQQNENTDENNIEDDTPVPPFLVTLKRTISLCKTESFLILLGIIAIIGDIFSTIGENVIMGKLIDAFTRENDMSLLKTQSMIMLAVYLLQSTVASLSTYIFAATVNRITVNVKNKLFSAIVKQDISFFDATNSGELTSRLTNDAAQLGSSLENILRGLILSFLKATIGLVYLFYISMKLTFAMTLLMPIVGISLWIQGKVNQKTMTKLTAAKAESLKKATEVFGQIRTIKTFVQELLEINFFAKNIAEEANLNKKLSLINSITNGAVVFAFNFCIVVAMSYGGSLVISGEITGGDLVSYCFFAQTVTVELGSLPDLFSQWTKIGVASVKVFEIIEKQEELENKLQKQPNKRLKYVQGDISFRNVTFSYPMRPENQVLRNFSLDIKSGSTVAIVGLSGGGKSTLFALLERFYDDYTGQVLIDGEDIQNIDRDWLRQQMALVNQEPLLFNTTIYNNIDYGLTQRQMSDKNAVYKAAEQANAVPFIESMPLKYDTNVGERGLLLSAGQRQRIAIARAILINPSILLLDEATSALDNQSEREVQSALEQLMKGRTSIVIAHRLSTVRNADLIIVMQHGEVIEKGTHEELLTNKGKYLELLNLHNLGDE
jgi:ABC-type multidrug transport system fused ATPase/permease subunit